MQNSKDSPNAGFKPSEEEEKMDTEDPGNENAASGKDSEVPSTEEPREDQRVNQELDASINSTNNINIANDDEDDGAEADMNNLDAFMPVSPILTTRIHKDHPVEQIIGDLNSEPQTKRMTMNLKEHEEPKKVIQALKDPSWIELMLGMSFYISNYKRTKQDWLLKGTQGYTQEEGIDYDEVFAHVARIEAIRLFLAYASFKNFVVYQVDVKSAFLYGKIEEEVYVCQPPGFEDPDFPDRIYKVEKALYDDIIFGSTKKKLCTEFEKMMHKKFQMSSMGELTFFLGLQVKQKEDGIFISQDKYVTEILKKFGFSDVKTASTPMETHKPLLKDADGEDVDEHMYRSMIGSLMYLTSSRPDIMFVVCVCARFQVNPKVSHLHAVKRIFRYLKGQPKLGLWYPKDSPFDLVAYTDSDYAGASLDRKSTTGGCQFLGCRLISWQCKKQTVVANSTTEAEYVAASSCCGQVLWIQNQLLDYGYNFMHTKIYIDNESTICIVKNPVFHSKTKHIEIRHHFIRDSNEKKLIQMIKIHTDKNVADLLTKAFDKGIGVNVDDSKLILLGINLLLLEKVNAARHNLLLLVNMVAFLAKPTKSDRFEQILDFLNANPIKYALMLQALVDGKKVIITETSVRRDLQLEDAKGIACLPNADIFEQLALMGYEKPSQKLTFYKALFSPQWKFWIHTILQCLSAKSTAWNEFSSTMASAIICLATNQKFNFSKYIFESMVKNVDSSVKFLTYPRFVQVFLDKQVGDMSTHDEFFVTPSHIKKVFGNMKRVGKGFSGAVTTLFPTMTVHTQKEMGEGSVMLTDPHHTPIIQPLTSQPQKKQSRRKQRKDTEIP
ncbi:putative ribonuclease H-like domain-containing protein [Tanacetum coccineum]